LGSGVGLSLGEGLGDALGDGLGIQALSDPGWRSEPSFELAVQAARRLLGAA